MGAPIRYLYAPILGLSLKACPGRGSNPHSPYRARGV